MDDAAVDEEDAGNWYTTAAATAAMTIRTTATRNVRIRTGRVVVRAYLR
jgi:hypothetical protein